MFIYAWTIVLAFMVMLVHLYPQLTLTEIAFASIPVGSIGGAWLFFLVCVLLNFLSKEAVTIGCVALAVATVLYLDAFLLKLRTALSRFKAEEASLWKIVGPLAAVTTLLGAPLYSSRYLPEDDQGNVWTGGSTWADLPIHLHMANSFLFGRNRVVYFDGMHSPVFAGENMKYPFLPDFHAAVLVKAGNSMRDAMWIPGFACFLSMVVLLFLLNRRVLTGLKNASIVNAASVLSVIFVLCAGGAGGIMLSLTGSFTKLIDGTLDPIQDDVGAPGTINWFGFLSHVMLPQRGATFAYPLVIFLVLVCVVAVRGRSKLASGDYMSLLVFSGIAAATLPLVQAHSFFGLGIYIAALGALELYRSVKSALPYLAKLTTDIAPTAQEKVAAVTAGNVTLSWALAGLFAFIGAYPQLKLFSDTAVAAKGFMVSNLLCGTLLNFPLFWWKSLSVTVFVFGFAAYSFFSRALPILKAGKAGAGKKADTDDDPLAKAAFVSDDFEALQMQAAVFIASTFLFIFGNVVKMQPWDRDNVKLFYIWLFIAAGFNALYIVAPFLEALIATGPSASTSAASKKPAPSANKLWLMLFPVLVVLMVWTGFLSYVRETGHNHILYTADEAAVGEWFRANTRTESVVMTSDTHRSPAGYYAGRPSLVAFTGWMWSHGYDYHERNNDRNYALEHITEARNPTASNKLYRWGVKYVLKEANSVKPEKIGETFLDGHVKRVFQRRHYHIFRVKYDGEEF